MTSSITTPSLVEITVFSLLIVNVKFIICFSSFISKKELTATGKPTFKKKNFSGIKNSAKIDDLFTVAEKIKEVLNADTRDYYLNESSRIEMN